MSEPHLMKVATLPDAGPPTAGWDALGVHHGLNLPTVGTPLSVDIAGP